jgi:hypothetical protein
MSNEQLEFNIGEDENPATIEMNEDGSEAVLADAPQAPEVEIEQPQAPQEESKQQHARDMDEYSSNVRKRIEKLTARLRETERREQAAIEYAKSVQQRASELEQQFRHTDAERLNEAKGRIDTQIAALKQVIRQAREEGDFDTETEAQERLTAILMDQRQIQQAAAQRQQQEEYAAQQAQQRQMYQQQQPVQQAAQTPDPRAEEWAEQNPWFGTDTVMTHAVIGLHRQLVTDERFDPETEEYYDELDRRIREAFPHKFQTGNAAAAPQQKPQRARAAHSVAPATRSSGVNNARRSVKLTPSQVAIAKKLGVPLEEYAKYVKD